MVDRAARHSGQPGDDRHLLVAAILDRLALTPWADVPFNAVPELIASKARLAVGCVHQPSLLMVDGLLDRLQPLDRTVLADVIRALSLVCDQVIELSGGIMVGGRPASPPPAGTTGPPQPYLVSYS